MFISKAEKQSMLDRIARLESAIDNIISAPVFQEHVVSIEEQPVLFGVPIGQKKRGRVWTPEQRERQSDLAKKRWEKKKGVSA
jgi:hypothetical protein